MIKRLLITFSFIVLVSISFSGITYAAQEGEAVTVSEELRKLNDLYKEGAITKDEYSKAKFLLLNPNAKNYKKKKEKLTAVERKRLKDEEQEELIALKKQLRAEKEAEREKLNAERNRIIEERQKTCSEDPKGKDCKRAKAQVKNILENIKLLGHSILEKSKKEREEEKQAIRERKERIKEERALEKQASLEEQEKIRAEKAARKAERERRKAKWKKACADDPEGKACVEGKPSEKIKSALQKIKKKLEKPLSGG